MGAKSRRDEPKTLIPTISRYRAIEYLHEPATLYGGDVLMAGTRIFVGLTNRTNSHGVEQLRAILKPHGYSVQGVPLREILHLKSACSYLSNNTILLNRHFIDSGTFDGFDIMDVPESEPAGANVLMLNGAVIIPAAFPETGELLQRRGFDVRAVEVSELQKAEAGVTCCSIVFNAQ
jgi:dimethylargininase